jgi:putative transposase
MIFYIHFNPQKHELIDDLRKWRWSSYNALIGNIETRLMRDEVIDFLGSQQAFIEFHHRMEDDRKTLDIIDDF